MQEDISAWGLLRLQDPHLQNPPEEKRYAAMLVFPPLGKLGEDLRRLRQASREGPPPWVVHTLEAKGLVLKVGRVTDVNEALWPEMTSGHLRGYAASDHSSILRLWAKEIRFRSGLAHDPEAPTICVWHPLQRVDPSSVRLEIQGEDIRLTVCLNGAWLSATIPDLWARFLRKEPRKAMPPHPA